MELLDEFPIIEVHPIGEFRMGVMGHGVTIRTAYGTYDFLKEIPTLIGTSEYNSIIEISDDKRYFKISGPDVKYILDSLNMKVSIYRITVGAEYMGNYAWSERVRYSSEENCVFGDHAEHISGFKRNVYIQCKWVDQSEILSLARKYQNFREKQLIDAVKAL